MGVNTLLICNLNPNRKFQGRLMLLSLCYSTCLEVLQVIKDGLHSDWLVDMFQIVNKSVVISI